MKKEAKTFDHFGPGLHVAAGRSVDAAVYDRYIGRWSRLFVPSVLAAASVAPGARVLDISTGTGEAAAMITTGFVVGADIAPAMLAAARARLGTTIFCPVAADGQALPFPNASFDAVICQLGLQFFPDPARGLAEFRRVLRPGARAAVCVISTAERAPMWGIFADTMSRRLPEQRAFLELSFSLADQTRLAALFSAAGFQDVQVATETRSDTIGSFEDYWEPIEAGLGAIPQVYLSLPEHDRRAVREEVKSRLSRFEQNGRLTITADMLIASGKAP